MNFEYMYTYKVTIRMHTKASRLQCFLFIFLMLGSCTAFAQPSPFDEKYVDSITPLLSKLPDDSNKVNHLSRLASMYLFVKPELTLQYSRQGAEMAQKINYPVGQINCMAQQAFYFATHGEWAKSIALLNEAIPLAEKYQPYKLVYLYNISFINAATKRDWDLALNWALKAKDYPGFASFPKRAKWPTYMQLGMAYDQKNIMDSAIYYSNLLQEYVKEIKDYSPDLANNSNTIAGNIAYKQNNDSIALTYYRLADNGNNIAKVYLRLNQWDSAKLYATKGFDRAMILQTPYELQEAAKILAQVYASTNPTKANKFLNIYINSRDSLYSLEKLNQLEQLKLNEQKSHFEIEKKLAASRTQFFIGSLLAALLIFFIILLLLWRNNRFKRKANEQLTKAFTDLKSTQSQLIQSEKMASLGELTAGIAHEIQNPLNFVNNFSEVNTELIDEMQQEMDKGNLADAKAISNDIKENEQKINHHGKRADAIVKGMLQHSRSSNNVKEPTDINALADEYLRLAYHGLRAKDKSFNATMKTNFDETIGNINIIPQDIGRVILNLITNAFYVVNEKSKQNIAGYDPTVSVSTKKVGDKVEIKVADNGNGIPQKILDKIFQPFFTTKPTGQGTGLGLSLSYDIVKAHGGELKVETKEGEGSAFIIQIPVV